LNPAFRALLAQLRQKPGDADRLEEQLAEWEEAVWQGASALARQMLAAAPPRAFGGRETKEGTFRAAVAQRGFRTALYATLSRAAQARQRPSATEENVA
jgi:hypothetical protein